ncbi:hypothetical protein Vretifemale_15453 [Volvox reticuliferus]|uniref:Uncharacterized protein n=1 Tax=Volvox reticuliferus TaxID=1737510 RepID=A0A8J4CPP0_9CHLO|nr:hypothetical protein Vretifemale_15453 [Volvox reticuliferus]
MEGVLNTAQTILTGYDVTLQRQIRSEERAWRAEDLAYRQHEREVASQELQFMLEERTFLAAQIQQAHVDNARALWQRFVNRNRTEVQEKAEQLKALSALAALLAGFALVRYEVGVEVAAVVLCSLMLASIMRVGKMYVSEQEEAEFMHQCHVFVSQYRPGHRPPAPVRTFAAYWAHRCEGEWSTAFRLFTIGVPCFFVNLALAGVFLEHCWRSRRSLVKCPAANCPTSCIQLATVVTCVVVGSLLRWHGGLG